MVAGMLLASESSVQKDDAKNYQVIIEEDQQILEKWKISYEMLKQRKINSCGDRLVIFPENFAVQVFEFIKMICCAIEFICYPFGMNHGYQNFPM